MPRQSTYTEEIGSLICEHLAAGKSLRATCREPGYPAPQTVLDWVEANPDFAGRYARARATGYQLLADEILDIADDASRDVVQTEKGPAVDHDHIKRATLRVDTRKWMLAKMLPKIYGDRQTIDHNVNATFEERLDAGRRRAGGE